MDDFLQFLNILLCGRTDTGDFVDTGQFPDPVLLGLFISAGVEGVVCVDPDERTMAAYPRLILSGEEGEQMQTGDGDARSFFSVVRLEIVTRQNAQVTDELELLTQMKARVTDLFLGREDAIPSKTLPPLQGRTFTIGGNSYNVAVFSQVRPTARLPAEDPTIKRWGGTYRVLLHRLLA